MANNNEHNTNQLEQMEQEELGPPKADFRAPPPYETTNTYRRTIGTTLPQLYDGELQQIQSEATANTEHQHNLQQDQNQTHLQPQVLQHQPERDSSQSYPIHADQEQIQHGKLPTYEEVQMEKSLNGELPPEFFTTHQLQQPLPPPPPNPLLANLRENNMNRNGHNDHHTHPPVGVNIGNGLTFIAIDSSDADNIGNNTDSTLLGTDIMFILAFMVAFLFNWIGFLMLTCFCHTIAARYGALSGFGLSLAKWTLIVKNSTDLASHENSWLWWLIMAFGFLICVRALIQYVSIKRTWRLLSTSAQENLLFFY